MLRAIVFALCGMCCLATGTGIPTAFTFSAEPIQTGGMPLRVSPLTASAATEVSSVAPDAIKEESCKENELYSKEFGKCLPKPGTDGFIGEANKLQPSTADKKQEQIVSEALRAEIAPLPHITTTIQPHSAVNADRNLPLRGWNSVADEVPERVMGKHQFVTQPLMGAGNEPAAKVRRNIHLPIRRLAIQMACPPGYSLLPGSNACIAQVPQAFRRGSFSDDDDFRMMHRPHMHFRRRARKCPTVGDQHITVPILVFVLPPRNETIRAHRDAKIAGDESKPISPAPAPTTPTPAPAPTPAAPETKGKIETEPKPSAPAPESKPAPETPKGKANESALRRAEFVNPMVHRDAAHQQQPLKGSVGDAASVPLKPEFAETLRFINPAVAS